MKTIGENLVILIDLRQDLSELPKFAKLDQVQPSHI
jgi:hypothetical protein